MGSYLELTTVPSNCVVTANIPIFTERVDGSYKEDYGEIPSAIRESLRHCLEVMVTREPHGEIAATIAEWSEVFDTISHILDPEYDDGWRAVE